jgi:hypothetical protein
MDVWPTFWTKITKMINSGYIFSSVEVKEEINKGNDELTVWLKNNAPQNFFISLTPKVIEKYQETQDWARKENRYTEAALKTFADVADAYLVATAAANKMTLVTYEESNPQAKKRVLIPDVCNGLGVRYCNLNTVLRELGTTI